MNKEKNDSFQSILEEIKKAKSIGLVSHTSPDGDNISSLISMYIVLKNMGKEVYMIKVDEIPDYLKFMKYSEDIKSLDLNKNLDLLIIMDCGDKKRIGETGEYLFEKAKKTINIDHHKSNDRFCDMNYVDINASSTAQIIYEFLRKNDISIDEDIANAIFVGINTDTNRFLYENSDKNTFIIAADLIDKGADKKHIYKNLYQCEKKNSVLLKAKIVNESKFLFGDKVTYSYIKKLDLEKYNLEMEDVESAVNQLRDIENVELSIIFKEVNSCEYKISFRSKDYIDVSEIAKYFGGGGHIRASGAKVCKNLVDLEKEMTERLEKIEFI